MDSKQKILDLQAMFVKVFDTKAGQAVLEHLEGYSKQGFPDVNNVNFTYAKAGQQQLVDYIKAVVKTTKGKAVK
jgi:phosphoribosylformimino-5-aminoimidazole carboxamide ribonucleotide (ProFAR) isomerase